MSWENLIKDQSIFSVVVILLIPFDCLLIFLGENWCWSLSGLLDFRNDTLFVRDFKGTVSDLKLAWTWG